MKTPSIYIFDAGSSKTDLLIHSDKPLILKTLSGFNPNRMDTSFSKEVDNLNIPLNSKVYFYGSGVSSKEAIQYVNSLFHTTEPAFVASDILGAARACLTNKPGITCILGTGAIASYYNGNSIIDRKGGYGYLIDDIGGGLELSKVIVSHWLNQNFNKETDLAIEKYFQIKRENFITYFYSKKDLHELTGVCTIIPTLTKNDSYLNETLHIYFNAFINRHVLPLCIKHEIFEINIVGSIGEYFNTWIKKSAAIKEINIAKTFKKPIQGILDFHLTQK